jgi:UDP-N-acetylglucosamine 2-epimerase (non-hydrolysing)
VKPEILLVAGARPNFMKIAPVASALIADGRLRGTILHTGQHYDREMSDLFFEQLKIPQPEIRLGVGSASHARQTAEIMTRLEPVLTERSPAAILVVGDVNSTIAAALVAVKLGVPVAHVEAGLRSFDRSMPEEINRILTDAISTWLFVTERSGMRHLAAEGVDEARVHFTGNVMIDTLMRCRERAARLRVPEAMGLTSKGYALMTLHRPSNVDAARQLDAMLQPIRELGRRMPVIFPVHPRTRKMLEGVGKDAVADLRLTQPLGYLEFLGLMADARVVLTDSGGIQEETTVLGVPCVTLRNNTERPVTLDEGTNHLAGTDPAAIRETIARALSSGFEPRQPELWDGRAAERIVDVLASDLVG